MRLRTAEAGAVVLGSPTFGGITFTATGSFKLDQRDYGIGVQILREIGVRSMRLLSNNLRKLVAIESYCLPVTEWLPLEIPASPSNLRYLTAKRNKLGHVLRGL